MIIVIFKIKNKNKLKQLVIKCFFISAICHGQWYLLLTYYKNYVFFFIIMSPKQLCFPFLLKMMLDISTFSKHIE